MNRKIKFKAWDKYKEKMNFRLDYFFSLDNIFGELIGNSRYEIMQFTGLKDKNKKEIYEGDIIKLGKEFYSNKVAIVEFCEGFIGARMRDYGIAGLGFNTTCEVIGNKFENPELLSDAKSGSDVSEVTKE